MYDFHMLNIAKLTAKDAKQIINTEKNSFSFKIKGPMICFGAERHGQMLTAGNVSIPTFQVASLPWNHVTGHLYLCLRPCTTTLHGSCIPA